MNEKRTRPTKKQHELLDFIEQFIAEHEYSPTYREIMRGLNYTSVATVALHVNNLIARGHLVKRGHSARSLEIVSAASDKNPATETAKPDGKKWLTDKVGQEFIKAEALAPADQITLDNLTALVKALRLLGLAEADEFAARLAKLTKPN